jgi:hypothetical protein
MTLVAGNVARFRFRLRNNIDWEQLFRATRDGNEVPIDLRTAHLRMTIADVLDISDENNRIYFRDPPNGVSAFESRQRAAVPPGRYDADCLLFGADGSVTTLFVADIEIEQGDTSPVLP